VDGDAKLNGRMEGDRLTLAGAGEWTADQALSLDGLISARPEKHPNARSVTVDMGRVTRLDTYGAWLLERLLREFESRGAQTSIVGLSDNYQRLIDGLRNVDPAQWPEEHHPGTIETATTSIGRTVYAVLHSMRVTLEMLGAVTVAMGRVVAQPSRFRLTSMIHHLDNVAWRAVPIILLITFLIGCIIAQQGIFHFGKFGADIYVVDMVGILVMRELGVLIVAIMVAGRSGSAFTAELGSMKMREEVDALRTMGFDPIEVLVLPRVIALIIGLPILTFIGSLAALYGGGLVAWLYGNIDPDIFLQRLREAITIEHFKVGMIKAPFMALLIGVVACVQGIEVKGSAESLGLQTTASVVESIFMVIVLDGFFAIFFASIGL
jgi:phospholipid/cholesterol/gamma-HCH transport system permease protein